MRDRTVRYRGKLAVSLKFAIAVTAMWAAGACSSDETSSSTDGGVKTGTGGQPNTSGSVGMCGTNPCLRPAGAENERIKTCCTDTNGCGLKLPEASKCLAQQPGYQSSACPTFTNADASLSLPGCCSPNGCGGLDAYVGCIENSQLGQPSVACTYVPGNDCTQITEVTCDGPEDCSGGKHCCAEFQATGLGVAYTHVGCYDSCPGPDAGGMVGWRELCHAGDVCEDKSPGVTCSTSLYLPATLTRCDTTGSPPPAKVDKSPNRVNCGSRACDTGEKCCLRSPHLPYCAAAGDSCECVHPGSLGGELLDAEVPTTTDAGKDASIDASSDGATPEDAAPTKDAAIDARHDK